MSKKKLEGSSPTLADKAIDLSQFELVDLTADEKRKLPKPRVEFPTVVRQVLSLYPTYEGELRLDKDEFDPEHIARQMEKVEALQPYIEWLERRLEQVKDTKLALQAESYRCMLKFYQRAQAAAEFNPQVGHEFAFVKDHFGVGRKNKKQEEQS